MPDLIFQNVGVSAIAAAVPTTSFDNLEAGDPFTPEDAKAIVDKTGIRYRRIAGEGTCASDLCHAAAEQLLNGIGIERESIDALIFVSQTPDYRMPATGIILQDRLGLGKNTMAFDLNLGCSGFVYGLSVAYSLLANNGIRRVLLLNGETRSRAYSQQDRATALLFGDSGSAVLVERDEGFGKSVFSLFSDGSRFEHIIIKSGGYRYPSTPASLAMQRFEDGSVRNGEHGQMQGASVFEFLLQEVPPSIRHTLEFGEIDPAVIDFYVFHQANLLMNEHLRIKMKIPKEKMPYSLDNFGNTSSVSIPLTMVASLGTKLECGQCRLLLSGFGVGLSWGNAAIQVANLNVLPLLEVS
jgi:3-oxoacyl-[acyl-carrier-protein] synthase-3